MTNFNVHWKGRPHHHLPRIRVASRRASVQNRSIAQVAAEQALRTPLSPALSREKKTQRFKLRFRRRGTRTSRSSSSAAWARRRDSLGARRNIRLFGWNSPVAEIANIVTTRSPSSIRSPFVLQNHITTTNITTIPPTDGAGGSVIRRVKGSHSNNGRAERRDSVNFAQDPLYWTSTNLPRSTRGSAPVSPLDKDRRRCIYRESQAVRSSRVYDQRIAPNSCIETGNLAKSNPSQSKLSNNRRSTLVTKASRSNKKQKSIHSSVFWEAVSSMVLQPNAQGSTAPATVKSIVKSILSDKSSRTSSQREALRKFTKELELHLRATRALPKQYLITSPTATTVSANTITELMPYQSEFQSAGLAVTSGEQRPMAFGKSSKIQKVPTPPQAPTKDGRYYGKPSPGKSGMGSESEKKVGKFSTKKAKQPTYASGSTGTTIMGFTPSHEKTYDRPRTPISRRHTSSDYTIVGFTSPHEMADQPVSPASRTHTKKSLPWLRKPQPLPDDPPTMEKSSKSTVHVGGMIKDIMLPTSPQCDSSSYEIMTFPSRTERERIKSLENIRRQELKYSNNDTHEPPTEFSQRMLSDVTFAETRPDRVRNKYSNMATQTDQPPGTEPENSDRTKKAMLDRAPMPSGLGNTFPMAASNCSADCQKRSLELAQSALRMHRPSRVQLEKLDQAIQSDDIENAPPPVEPQTADERPLKSLPGWSGRNRVLSFKSATESTPGPFEASPSLGSHYQNVDGDLARTGRSQMERKSERDTPWSAPTRQAPSPPRCIECDRQIERAIFVPESQREIQLEPGYQVRLSSRNRPSHTCTRSSIQCQQCFPSRQTSAAISPLQPTSPTEPQKRPSRTSVQSSPTRNEIDQPGLTTIECVLDEVIKGFYYPAEHFMQKDTMPHYAEQSPIADPVKRPTIPKIGLRSAPPAQPPPKQTEHISMASRVRVLPQVPQRPMILTTAIPFGGLPSTPTPLDNYSQQLADISDKAALRGLHVATAAACDEDVNKWIEEVTGVGIRTFLADLSKFEGLGVKTLAGMARRASRQRRDEVREWEVLREMRLKDQVKIGPGDKLTDDWVERE